MVDKVVVIVVLAVMGANVNMFPLYFLLGVGAAIGYWALFYWGREDPNNVKELNNEYVDEVKFEGMTLSERIKEKIVLKYASKCPCCGENKRSVDDGIYVVQYASWYAKIDGKKHPFRFWEKKYRWVRLQGRCSVCNTKWFLPDYPEVGITKDELFSGVR